jgi:hypothetical protein
MYKTKSTLMELNDITSSSVLDSTADKSESPQ